MSVQTAATMTIELMTLIMSSIPPMHVCPGVPGI